MHAVRTLEVESIDIGTGLDIHVYRVELYDNSRDAKAGAGSVAAYWQTDIVETADPMAGVEDRVLASSTTPLVWADGRDR